MLFSPHCAMSKHRYLLAIIAFSALISVLPMPPVRAMSPSQVLVVYAANGTDVDNDGVSDSRQLAEYYAQKRGIPASNVLGLNISVVNENNTYAYDYPRFYNDVVRPIKTRIAKL